MPKVLYGPPNKLCFCLSHMMSLTIGNSFSGFDLFSSFAASQVLRRTTYFTRTGSTFRQQLGKKVVLTSKIDQRKREMAVKNARNFVRDVNTRKICYSFCHLEMVEPLYYMQYYPVHRERSQAKLEDRAFFLHKIKANFFKNGQVEKYAHSYIYVFIVRLLQCLWVRSFC